MLWTDLSWDSKDLEMPAFACMVQGTSSGVGAKGKLEESCDEDEGSATSSTAVG